MRSVWAAGARLVAKKTFIGVGDETVVDGVYVKVLCGRLSRVNVRLTLEGVEGWMEYT